MTQVSNTPTSPYQDSQQAARYCCLALSTLRQYTRMRSLPSYKVGKRVLYKQTDLEAFIEKHLRRSHEQLDKALDQRQRALQTTTLKGAQS